MIFPICFCLSQVRKFVAKDSAGLRIRSHPSLQSEQIGVVKVNGTITFIDEVIFKETPGNKFWTERFYIVCTIMLLNFLLEYILSSLGSVWKIVWQNVFVVFQTFHLLFFINKKLTKFIFLT